MTVPIDIAFSGPYYTNGAATDFPFEFKANSETDVSVFRVAPAGTATVVSPALYSVALAPNGAPGGTVQFLVAPATAVDELFVGLTPSFEQNIKYEDEGAFNQSILNRMMDEAALRSIFLRHRVERSLSLPFGEEAAPLPSREARKGKFLGFSTVDGVPVAVDGTDSTIAADLISSDPGKGAALIKTKLNAVGAVEQTIQDILNGIITPQRFGAVGDGVADDGPALNLMANHIRTLIASNSFIAINVTGHNGIFRTTESVNLTGLAAWSMKISDMLMFGQCTGKAIFDLINTRGYVLDNVSFLGDKDNQPSCAFQAQRGTPGGFCDNATYRDVNIDGWYSRAATHDYGQETTQWVHCTVYNRNFDARVAIFEGYNVFPMTSDYAPTMTGGTSFINKQFLNCDFRHLPADENIAFATNITNAANAVVTAEGHPFANGDQVVFQYIAGMPDMTAQIATVSAVTADTFTINIDTTSFGAFGGSGNIIRRADVSPVYIARTEGFAMHDCYTVAYGRAPIEIGFPDPGFLRCEQLSFTKMLFEGSGHEAEILFNPTGACSVQGFELTTYNAHSYVALLANANPSFTLSFFGFKVESVDPLFAMTLTNGNAQFAAYDAHILFSSLANVSPETFADFNGTIVSIADGKNTLILTGGIRMNNQRLIIPGTFGSDGSGVYIDAILDGVPFKLRAE